MTPDPNDPTEQAAYRELDKSRRTPKHCPDNCPCRQEDAMTTPLDLEEFN